MMVLCADGWNCEGCRWREAKTLDDLSDANLDCPSIMEVDSIVFCKKCKYSEQSKDSNTCWCVYHDIVMYLDDFCSRGEKKEND